MGTTPTVPPAIEAKLQEIESATEAMVALEDEIRALRRRVESSDVPAIHLGLRQIAEALLRHSLKATQLDVPRGPDGTLNRLKDALYNKLKEELDSSFWRHLGTIQTHVNAHTHHQENDVYQAGGLLGRPSPWDEVESAMHALKCILHTFVQQWPPPPKPVTASPPPPTEEDAEDEAPATDRAPPSFEGIAPTDLADVTAKAALENEAVRAQLEKITGMHRRGVSRRLNAAHGKTKMKNLFPDAFQPEPDEDTQEDERGFDYETIGNLSIKEARDNDLSHDIAVLTNRDPASVRRKLAGLHGGGVVRRQFEWYDPQTVGELTVRTALSYNLAPLLAREFRVSRASILARLRGVPGQTKLRTVFEQLG